jgi:hypothetical protein
VQDVLAVPDALPPLQVRSTGTQTALSRRSTSAKLALSWYSTDDQLTLRRRCSSGDWQSRFGLSISLGCSKNGEHSVKAATTSDGDPIPVVGDVIRFRLSDQDGYEARFDVPVSDEAGGGYLTDVWVHLALVVAPAGKLPSQGSDRIAPLQSRVVYTWSIAGAQVYLDSRAVPPADYSFDPAQRDDDGDGVPNINSAFPDPTAFFPEMGGFDGLGAGTDGPRLGSSYASGAGNWDSSYEGNIAGIVLWNKALSYGDVACLYGELSQNVAVCQATQNMWGTIWSSSLRSPMPNIVLGNDAYHDENVGIVFDGQGDYATITGLDGLVRGSDFTLAFWITKTQVSAPCL